MLVMLLGRVASGDRAAFEDLYRRTAAKLFGTSLRILGDRAEAEEALQKAYLAIWQRAAAFDASQGTAMTWLLTIARNNAVDRLRAGRSGVPTSPLALADDVADPAPNVEALIDAEDERRRLAACIRTLGTEDAALIRTAFFEGATYAELATRSETPLGTIKSRIRRALMRLRSCLA